MHKVTSLANMQHINSLKDLAKKTETMTWHVYKFVQGTTGHIMKNQLHHFKYNMIMLLKHVDMWHERKSHKMLQKRQIIKS